MELISPNQANAGFADNGWAREVTSSSFAKLSRVHFLQMPLCALMEFMTTFPRCFGVPSLPIPDEINERERDQDQLSLVFSSANLLCVLPPEGQGRPFSCRKHQYG